MNHKRKRAVDYISTADNLSHIQAELSSGTWDFGQQNETQEDGNQDFPS